MGMNQEQLHVHQRYGSFGEHQHRSSVEGTVVSEAAEGH